VAATLSVVVPVYGTKRDLPACLESLRTQSLRDAEFLLVDDASPDGAGAVLAEYARRDSRFRVLTHSQNRGLFAARMTGADAATGKYLAFLDSDDFVSVDFYRAAVALAEENDFDLVMGDTVWQRENGDRFVRPVHADCVLEDELRGDAVRDAFFQQAMTCYSFHTIWNKVIRFVAAVRALLRAAGEKAHCDDGGHCVFRRAVFLCAGFRAAPRRRRVLL